MACMEHSCTRCDWYEADNRRQSYCPKCGARCTNHYDDPEGPETEEEECDGTQTDN